MRISVICIYNNESSYRNQLCSSLQMQGVDFELIGIDNRNQRFSSAAAALNYGVSISSGDILVFSHQDITLKTCNELAHFASAVSSLPVGSIIGTQGIREKSNIYYENLTAGADYIEQLKNDYPNEIIKVDCVDEGFFGMKRKTYEAHPFDEKLCDNWHLYCVESCLNARREGHSVYVMPIQLHHYSLGTINISYMLNLKKLCNTYRRDFKYIWTTCYKVKTHPLYINGLIALWVIHRKIRGRSL